MDPFGDLLGDLSTQNVKNSSKASTSMPVVAANAPAPASGFSFIASSAPTNAPAPVSSTSAFSFMSPAPAPTAAPDIFAGFPGTSGSTHPQSSTSSASFPTQPSGTSTFDVFSDFAPAKASSDSHISLDSAFATLGYTAQDEKVKPLGSTASSSGNVSLLDPSGIPITAATDVKTWPSSALKSFLDKHGVNHASCVEKSDYVALVESFIRGRGIAVGVSADAVASTAPRTANSAITLGMPNAFELHGLADSAKSVVTSTEQERLYATKLATADTSAHTYFETAHKMPISKLVTPLIPPVALATRAPTFIFSPAIAEIDVEALKHCCCELSPTTATLAAAAAGLQTIPDGVSLLSMDSSTLTDDLIDALPPGQRALLPFLHHQVVGPKRYFTVPLRPDVSNTHILSAFASTAKETGFACTQRTTESIVLQQRVCVPNSEFAAFTSILASGRASMLIKRTSDATAGQTWFSTAMGGARPHVYVNSYTVLLSVNSSMQRVAIVIAARFLPDATKMDHYGPLITKDKPNGATAKPGAAKDDFGLTSIMGGAKGVPCIHVHNSKPKTPTLRTVTNTTQVLSTKAANSDALDIFGEEIPATEVSPSPSSDDASSHITSDEEKRVMSSFETSSHLTKFIDSVGNPEGLTAVSSMSAAQHASTPPSEFQALCDNKFDDFTTQLADMRGVSFTWSQLRVHFKLPMFEGLAADVSFDAGDVFDELVSVLCAIVAGVRGSSVLLESLWADSIAVARAAAAADRGESVAANTNSEATFAIHADTLRSLSAYAKWKAEVDLFLAVRPYEVLAKQHDMITAQIRKALTPLQDSVKIALPDAPPIPPLDKIPFEPHLLFTSGTDLVPTDFPGVASQEEFAAYLCPSTLYNPSASSSDTLSKFPSSSNTLSKSDETLLEVYQRASAVCRSLYRLHLIGAAVQTYFSHIDAKRRLLRKKKHTSLRCSAAFVYAAALVSAFQERAAALAKHPAALFLSSHFGVSTEAPLVHSSVASGAVVGEAVCTVKRVAFYSNVLGFRTKRNIPLEAIICISTQSGILGVGNSIIITFIDTEKKSASRKASIDIASSEHKPAASVTQSINDDPFGIGIVSPKKPQQQQLSIGDAFGAMCEVTAEDVSATTHRKPKQAVDAPTSNALMADVSSHPLLAGLSAEDMMVFLNHGCSADDVTQITLTPTTSDRDTMYYLLAFLRQLEVKPHVRHFTFQPMNAAPFAAAKKAHIHFVDYMQYVQEHNLPVARYPCPLILREDYASNHIASTAKAEAERRKPSSALDGMADLFVSPQNNAPPTFTAAPTTTVKKPQQQQQQQYVASGDDYDADAI